MPRETTPAQDLIRGIWEENPVLIQMLGLCPALAVTNTVKNALAMSAATFFVICCSSVLVSSCKRFIPREVRISAYILVIATFVTLADMMLQAYAPVQHKELGAFIALIVVNCMILGRQEAFSSKNTVLRSLLDAIGTGIGFTIALLMLGGFREILGIGTFFDIPLFGSNFEPWVVFVLPAGGFLTLGFIILGMGYFEERKKAGNAA
ncbi:MAG: electron transport complex subunit E [Xanthomonadales bacterium]|jgi:electron transport complex protein RnfE|nr:electron transport complex subunit E [Xanthomonadales bacterium]